MKRNGRAECRAKRPHPQSSPSINLTCRSPPRPRAKRTQDLASTLKRLDLFIPRVITVQNKDGAKYNLEGFFVVDEQKLDKSDEKEAGALLRSRHLAWIYMHLL